MIFLSVFTFFFLQRVEGPSASSFISSGLAPGSPNPSICLGRGGRHKCLFLRFQPEM